MVRESIGDYKILSRINEGAFGEVFLAEKDGSQYALKLVRCNTQDERSIRRIRWEATSLARISHPLIVKVYDTGFMGSMFYLVTEYISGENIAELLRRQGKLQISFVISVARDICQMLMHLRDLGIVHRDIKPENLLVTNEKRAKLIDFGLASDSLGGQSSDEENAAIGSVFYSSPEQLGLLKRGLDFRSDLYSLGVCLYEMASGARPFQGSSFLEVADAHLKVTPPNLENYGVPKDLSRIVETLLQKDPDDRYQSLDQLWSDLSSCEDNLSNSLEVEYKASEDVPVARRIFGRDDELKLIRGHLEGVSEPSIHFISAVGESGSGKSMMCLESVRRYLGERYLLIGKGDKLSQQPFGFVREAIHSLLASSRDRTHVLDVLVHAAQGLEKYLVASLGPVIPGINVDLDAIEISSDETGYLRAIEEFLLKVTQMLGGGAVIFIDDVQWVDKKSLQVLGSLVQKSSVSDVIFFATARPESNGEVLVDRLVGEDEAAQARHLKFKLGPISADAWTKMVSDYLNSSVPPRDAIEMIGSISRGNPFMIKETFRNFIEAGVIKYQNSHWTFDSTSIPEIQFSQNISDLVLQRLRNLEPLEFEVLKYASVVGLKFNLEMLSRIVDLKSEQLEEILERVMHQDFIIKVENHYFFAHDSIREALYKEIPAEAKASTHLKIAESLDAIEVEGADDKKVYELALHYRMGSWATRPDRVLSSNLAAADLALRSFAYEEAQTNLVTCLRVLKYVGEVEPKLLVMLYTCLGGVYKQKGRSLAAVRAYRRALKYESDKLSAANLYARIVDIYMGVVYSKDEDRLREAEAEFRKGLKLLGIFVPQPAGLHFAYAVLKLVIVSLLMKVGLRKKRPTGQKEKNLLAVAQLLSMGVRLYFSSNRTWDLLALSMRMYSSVELIKPCTDTAKAMVYYGTAAGVAGRKKVVDEIYRRTLRLSEEINERVADAEISMELGVLQFFGKNLRLANKHWLDTIEAKQDWISVADFTATCDLMYTTTMGTGNIRGLEAIKSCRLVLMDKRGFDSLKMRTDLIAIELAKAALTGEESADENAVRLLEVVKKSGIIAHTKTKYCWGLLMYYIHSPQVSADFLDDIIAAYQELPQSCLTANLDSIRIYPYIALARSFQAERRQLDPKTMRRLKKDMLAAAMMLWDPMSMSVFYLAKARYYRFCKKLRKAGKSLDKAERLAEFSENFFVLAQVCAERARLSRMGNRSIQANHQAQLGYHIAQEKGLSAIANLISQEFEVVRSTGGGGLSTSSFGSKSQIKSVLSERYSSALLRVSLASAASLDPQTQSIMALDEVLKVLNAERAFLFLKSEADEELRFYLGRNNKLATLNTVDAYSESVVQKVKSTKQAVIFDNMSASGEAQTKSIVAYGLKSIMAVPLIIREEFLGVVYADSTIAHGIFSREDLDIFMGIAQHIAIAFETAKLARVEAERREMEKDLELSAAVQKMFLPSQKVLLTPTGALAGFYRPANQCGGDWWWYRAESDGGFSFILADVTGHGAAPAMITAALAAIIETYSSMNQNFDMNEALRTANEILHKFASEEFLVAVMAGRYFPDLGSMKIWSGASPFGFHFDQSGEPHVIGSKGSHLGKNRYSLGVSDVVVQSDERLIFFSDGIVEAEMADNRQIGHRRLLKIFSTLKQATTEEAVDSIISSVDSLTQSSKQQDDFTYLVIDIKKASQTKRLSAV